MWKLRDIFYDAEDVIDDFKCEAVRKQVVNHPNITFKDVIGRDVDKENIIDLLMKPSEGLDVPVIPMIWICVSEEFDLTRLLKLMIHSINKGEQCDDSTVEALQTCLRSLLNDKKFLLVLDDVWNENQARWIELRDLLRSMGGLSQSKIIVTTRSLKVASIMSSIRPYELKVLPHEDCLILFTKWAFNDGDDRQYPNLMRIGEEIVKKCKGVPLVVRTLGSLLFMKTDESDRISVRDNEIWKLEHAENEILPVLKLSYNHLPSHLQRCFAVMSLYKKDSIYYSDKVIQFWMENGLLEHSKQKQEWVDVGGRYLNELLSRCVTKRV
ncbi:putative disease resistance protein RGA1 [Gossypium hirsutum]|uniref:Disease resistance protein RGA1 n=1 Tax=Gossypium hirsutum TaxID=3635 RepID=A0A1U8IA57_GOSHI|nr:putative disease resistance protein RGA1 [Gossypium hirsutum]